MNKFNPGDEVICVGNFNRSETIGTVRIVEEILNKKDGWVNDFRTKTGDIHVFRDFELYKALIFDKDMEELLK